MGLWILWGVILYIGLYLLIKQISKFYGDVYHNKAVHLIILTYNSEYVIEYMIWSYHFWNKGKKGRITCLDTGSTDDTLAILERLKLRYPSLEVVHLHPMVDAEEAVQEWLERQGENKEECLVLDLRESEFYQSKKNSG